MVLFFILSGFLITNIIIKDSDPINFLIKRITRIIPLAWMTLIITLWLTKASGHEWLSSMLFYANLPPFGLKDITSHFWSLCVEVQFYFLTAIFLFFLKEKAFYVFPFLAIFITGNRIFHQETISIVTQFRMDEILAGCMLAIVYNFGKKTKFYISKINPLVVFPLVILSAHPLSGPINYLRPYLAMILIGSTLLAIKKTKINGVLESGFLFYMASISYALYVFHGIFSSTWLGSGDKMEKYLKRPLLLGVTFALSHLSTNYYEKWWIETGRKIIKSRKLKKQQMV